MARFSKKDIYFDYGIEYKNGKINAPVFGWINPLLKNGNKKIGKGVYHFSTLPTNSLFFACGPLSEAVLESAKDFCDGRVRLNISAESGVRGTCSCTCKDPATGEIICYATKGRYVFDNVRASLMRNTILARHFMEWTFRAISAQIAADRVQVVRIHAAGDFFSAAYAGMWRDIASSFPAVLFWTYTKVKALESAFDDLGNANIVKSMIAHNGKTVFNFGHASEIAALYWSLKEAGEDVFFCPCGIPGADNGAIKCNVCGACAAHKYVLFLEHSTTYNAAKDPDLEKVLACVADSFPWREEIDAESLDFVA